ncbi:GNAT family N-acetyltransferase [Acinetobacter wuhouensis]|uniref:GNAT family N-acetyltransferase n=1 Tax=Acinetobacter wuhouensis TaxID=1879050 RepID=UPI001023E95A|nr:GNAT family N-acetyltransferase [Acinetobacter wuhouensis]RZG73272.1 GNAT family N-acetyltransferase [Acinetobacter wuhouensis]
MSIQIRVATPNDIEQIFDIRTAVKENHLSKEQLTELGITDLAILALIEQKSSVWVAEFEQSVCGFAIADQEEGSVFAMFVYPDAEGKGIGKALLERVEHILFQHFSEICLETDGRSRACTFYSRQGWHIQEHLMGGDVKMLKRRPSTHALATE